MTLLELIQNCVPPGLAIVLQKYPIPSDRWIETQAADAKRAKELSDAATRTVRETARGTVAVSSMAPTIVSYMTSAYTLTSNTWSGAIGYLAIYVVVIVIGILSGIFVYNLVSGRSAEAIAIDKLQIPILHFGPKRTTTLSLVVYTLNGFLILLSVLIYRNVLPA
jgi:hypothetical protein